MGDLTYRFLCNLGRLLAKVIWRFEVSDATAPTVGPYILCPVHRSYVDFLVAGMAVPPDALHGQGLTVEGTPIRALPGVHRGLPVDREHATARPCAGQRKLSPG
ncbi:MAG: hypothetical protein R2789_07435 [Microthrixaceae bacterium]